DEKTCCNSRACSNSRTYRVQYAYDTTETPPLPSLDFHGGVPTNTNPRRENVACVCFSASLEDRESQQCAAKLRISCGGGDLQRSSCDASFDHQVGNPLARKTANSGRQIPRSSTEIACLAGANSG